MRQIKFHHEATREDAFFNEGVESVLYIRCMEHRAASQVNMAESNDAECGECVRQQCWTDMLGLIARAIKETPRGMDGRAALAALEESVLVEGIGTFGVSDEIEEALTTAAIPISGKGTLLGTGNAATHSIRKGGTQE